MKLLPQHIDELIARWLDQKTTAEENAQLQEWRMLAPENETYFNDMKYIFEKAAADETNPFVVDENKAWNNVLGAMQNKEASIKPISTNRFLPKRLLQLAAAVVLVVVITTVLYVVLADHTSTPASVHYTTNQNEIKQTLPDGSVVTVKAHSKLDTYQNKKREYTLNGTAGFTIQHEEKEPFIIHHEDVMIEDVGTQFEVVALNNSNTVKVTVTEGIVRLYTQHDKGIVLNAGEIGVYYKKQDVFAKTNVVKPEETIASLDFKDERLDAVIQKINTVYKCSIVLDNPEIKECRITVRFTDADLHDVVEIVTQTLNLWVKANQKTIIIGGKSCIEQP